MVKKCTKTTHTHDSRDSNYSNAVDGLDYVIREIQRQTPGTVWENCEDGGAMMTFNMVQNYVTSITNDANGALGSRQAAYGATYPFPPRYVDRYMSDDTLNSYLTRSFVFGGPWMQMNHLAELSPAERDFLGSEIQVFKRIRSTVRDGKVFHRTAPPGVFKTDALQSYNPATDTGVAVVTRNSAYNDYFDLFPSGLNPDSLYQVTFQDDRRVEMLSGNDLMVSGVRVNLAADKSAEVVYIQPK
jgi:alpha-galactosidase